MATSYDPISSTEMMNADAAQCVVEHKPLHWSDDGVVADLVSTARQPYDDLVAAPPSLWSFIGTVVYDITIMVLVFLPAVLMAFGFEIHR